MDSGVHVSHLEHFLAIQPDPNVLQFLQHARCQGPHQRLYPIVLDASIGCVPLYMSFPVYSFHDHVFVRREQSLPRLE